MSLRFKKLLASIFSLTLTVGLFTSFLGTNAYAQNASIIVHVLNSERIEIASIQGMSQNSVEIYDGDVLIGYGAYDLETHNKSIALSAGAHTIKVKFNGMSKEQTITLSPNETKALTFNFERTVFDLSPYFYGCDLSASFHGSYSGITSRVQAWDIYSSPCDNCSPYEIGLPVRWWVGGYFNNNCSGGGGIYSAEAKLRFSLSGTNYNWYNYAFYHISFLAGPPPCPDMIPGQPEWTVETSPDSGKYSIPSTNLNFTNWYAQYNHSGDVKFFLDDNQLSGQGISLVNANSDSALQIILGNPLHVWGIYTDGYYEDNYWHISKAFKEEGSGTLEVKMSSVPYDILGTGIKDGHVLKILDGADFSAGHEVSSEPTEIASGGTAVEGAVTDGVTRLLLRLSLESLDEVTFTLEGGSGKPEENGVLRSIEREGIDKQEGQSIKVKTHNVGDKEYAFAIYQAPENFVRYGHDEDKQTSERKITLKITSSRSPGFEPITKEIKLVRPPLILVHGLWSSPETWDKPNTTDDFKGALEKAIIGIHIFAADYRETNASRFAINRNVPYDCSGDNLKDIRKLYKAEYKIAMVQTDVIGHSMGGLLARIYAGKKLLYMRKENFAKGNIHKLITVNSPHYGSFLADAGIACLHGPHSLRAHNLLLAMEVVRRSLTKGAVEDLMTTSQPIKHMNGVNISSPSHAIVGDYKVDIVPIVPYTEPDNSKDFMVMGLPADYFDLHNMLIQEGYGDAILSNLKYGSDVVVSTLSQRGGVETASSIFNHHHMTVTTQEVANKTVELLNTDTTDSNLFNKGFSKN